MLKLYKVAPKLAHKQATTQTPQSTFIQPKLRVNGPNDVYEQEADAVADKVMRMSLVSSKAQGTQGTLASSVQRKCTLCEEEKKKKPIMRKSESGSSSIPFSASFAASLNASIGGGFSLPQGTRSFMENAFSTDFSSVKIHSDSQASKLSKGINAKAFTHGLDIYFNQGQYTPESSEGKRLLGHELTHVVQQSKGNTSGQFRNTFQHSTVQLVQSGVANEEPGVRHKIGNEIVQRKATDETSGPTPEEIEVTKREADRYEKLVIDKGNALIRYVNSGSYSTRRREWLALVITIVNETALDEDADISEVYLVNINAMYKLQRLEKDIAWEVDEAHALLNTTINKYEAELNRLGKIPSLSNELAIEALEDVDKAMKAALGTIAALTQEDVLQYYNFLSNDRHIKIGQLKADALREKSQEDAERLEQSVASDKGGVFDTIKDGLGTVWDVVGCSSVSECALDIGLTVLTAGVAKAGKIVAKGGRVVLKGKKAATAVKKVTKARKITTKVATGIAEKALKNARNIKKIEAALSAICSSMDTAGKWMKQNMPQLIGDFVSGHTTGKPEGAASVAMKRIRKTQIESFYELKLSRPDGSDVTWGVTALIAGRSDVGKKFLKTFLKQSLAFRGAVNITDQLISNISDSNFTSEDIQAQLLKSIRGALSNIVRESIQDIINNIPLGKDIIRGRILTTISEALLRSIQKSL